MSVVDYQGIANSANSETISDGVNIWVKVYNHIGSAVTNGYVYAIASEVDYTDTSNPVYYQTIQLPGTEADTSQVFGVIDNSILNKDTIANHAYGFVKLKGEILAYCNGGTNDLTYGDGVGTSDGLNYFLRSQVASSGVITQIEAETVGIILQTYTDAGPALKKVVLLGKQCAAIA